MIKKLFSELVGMLPQRILPIDEISGFYVRPGLYQINGARQIAGAVNFTVCSHNAVSCELLLYHRGEEEPYAVLEFPEHYRVGKVYSMLVYGLDIEEFEYAYRLDGPWEPGKGLLFDPQRPLLDPYARAVIGQSKWGEKQRKDGLYRARVVSGSFDWEHEQPLLTPMSDMIIYELHVRGFTKHAASEVKHPGTFAGLREKIPYLKELGVTAVELMPVFEFDEMMGDREKDGQKLLDYWGYNTVCFFAPNTSYTAANEYNREGTELKTLIKELHENGIEVILDVVFNHTAEGDENGPFISFKGFDNNIYYMLSPDGKYYNFSGCGNTLNCNHPLVQEMIVECLKYWTTTYHIDGFRFDLASIMGRSQDGKPMNNPPLLERLAFEPLLGNVKLIAEAWDAGGLYQVGNFPAKNRWAEWNGQYRDVLRDFLKGNFGIASEAAKRITGSMDLYAGEGSEYDGYNSSVNFLNCHDGFTLYDMYAYNEKHNEANGWDNTDGADDNRSWNCGTEGETDDPAIQNLRSRMIRNACAVLMCSRGTPMFLAGDEFANTQYGNNNSYCQDNEVSWLDWGYLKKNHELFEFFRKMIGFRKAHTIVRRELEPSKTGILPITVTDAQTGQTVSQNTKVLGILYAGFDKEKKAEDIVFLAVNVYWEELTVHLPSLPQEFCWYVEVNTGNLCSEVNLYKEEGEAVNAGELLIGARSVMVLCGENVLGTAGKHGY